MVLTPRNQIETWYGRREVIRCCDVPWWEWKKLIGAPGTVVFLGSRGGSRLLVVAADQDSLKVRSLDAVRPTESWVYRWTLTGTGGSENIGIVLDGCSPSEDREGSAERAI